MPASTGLYVLARMYRRPVSLEWTDTVAYDFWFVWLVALFFDVVHLVCHMPTPGIHLGPIHLFAHAGWLFMFPMLFVQLLACWQSLIGRSLRVRGLLFSVAAIAVMRLGVEPLPEFIRYLGNIGWHTMWDFWSVAFHLTWISCLVLVLVRIVIARYDTRCVSGTGLSGLGQRDTETRILPIVTSHEASL